jgi:hypothetical protein
MVYPNQALGACWCLSRVFAGYNTFSDQGRSINFIEESVSSGLSLNINGAPVFCHGS